VNVDISILSLKPVIAFPSQTIGKSRISNSLTINIDLKTSKILGFVRLW
jgi:hypothetical protein